MNAVENWFVQHFNGPNVAAAANDTLNLAKASFGAVGSGLANGIESVGRGIGTGVQTGINYFSNPNQGLGGSYNQAVQQENQSMPYQDFNWGRGAANALIPNTGPTAGIGDTIYDAGKTGGQFASYGLLPGLSKVPLISGVGDGIGGTLLKAGVSGVDNAAANATSSIGQGASPQDIENSAVTGFKMGVIPGVVSGFNPIESTVPRAITNLAGGYAAGRSVGLSPSESLATGAFTGMHGLGTPGTAGQQTIDEATNRVRATAATGLLDKPVPETTTTTLENGSQIHEPFTPKTVDVPNNQADFYFKNGRLPNEGEVAPSTYTDTGTTMLHFHPESGQLMSWSTDSPQFAQSITGKNLTAGLSTRRALPSELPTGRDAQQNAAAANIQSAIDNGAPVQTGLPENTGTGSDLKERKFITSAKDAENLSPEGKALLEGTYKPRSNAELDQTVHEAIAKNPEAARTAAMTGHSDESTALAIRLAEKAAAEGDHTTEAEIINEKARRLTEAGREVQAAAMLKKLSPEGQAMTLARDIQQWNEKNPKKAVPELSGEQVKAITEGQRAIDAMPTETPEQEIAKGMAQQKLWENMADQVPRGSAIDKFLALRRTGLLTGPRTLGKVILSHVLHNVTEGVSKVVGSGVDAVTSAVTGQRSLTPSFEGYGKGLVEGAGNAKRLLVNGYDPKATYDSIKNRRITFGDSPTGKLLDAYMNITGRVHASMPEAGMGAVHANSIADTAKVTAKNEGLTGDAYSARVAELKANPTEEMQQTASEEAAHSGFQNKTGASELLSNLNKTKGIGKVTQYLFPFTRVPSAIATEVTNYSPIGAVKTIVESVSNAKGADGWTPEVQRKFAMGIGRSITGTALIYLGTQLAKKGIVSLGYPADQKTRDQWQLEGRTADSILLDGKWRTLTSLGPAGDALILGAYWQHGSDGNIKKPGNFEQALTDTGTGYLSSQANQPYVQGFSGLSNAITNPAQSGKTFVKDQVTSIVPTLVSTTASATDPLQRETKGIGQAFESKIPILRENLPPKLNVFGEPVPNTGSPAEKMLDPTYPSTASTDPTVKYIGDLAAKGFSATPGQPNSTITLNKQNTKLTQDQIDALNLQTGPAIKQAYAALISTPGFQQADPEQQQKLLTNAASSIHSSATTAIKAVGDVNQALQQGAPGAATSGLLSSASGGSSLTREQEAAQLTLAKEAVAAGKQQQMQVGQNMVIYDPTSANGYRVVNLTTEAGKTADAQYQLSLQEAQRSNDYATYRQLQAKQYDALQQKISTLDPKVDQAQILALQNQQQDITHAVAGYDKKGGFKAAGKGRSGKGSVPSGLRSRLINITSTTHKPKSSTLKAYHAPKIPVTRLKA